jgi:hypothetical protein
LVYKIDTKPFLRPQKQEYLLYIDYKRNKTLHKLKVPKVSIRMTSEFSLLGLPQKKVIHSLYN